MPPRPPVILLIDDDDAYRENIAECLEAEGFACWAERTADDALRRLAQGYRAPDAIVLDLWVPGMAAARFVSHVKERATWSGAPIVLVTAAPEREIPEALGVDAVLQKPFPPPRLTEILRTALEARAAAAPFANEGTVTR